MIYKPLKDMVPYVLQIPVRSPPPKRTREEDALSLVPIQAPPVPPSSLPEVDDHMRQRLKSAKSIPPPPNERPQGQ